MTDEEFAEARALARAVDDGTRTEAEFRAAFPALPPSGVIGRDYASFSIAQRDLVIELLLADRFSPRGRGGDARWTQGAGHARGRDVARAGACSGSTTSASRALIAAALDAALRAAVDRVRADWERGVPTPLALAPLHHAGAAGRGRRRAALSPPDEPVAPRREQGVGAGARPAAPVRSAHAAARG